MAVSMEVTIDDSEIRQLMEQLSDRITDLSKPMKLAGERMKWSIDENFDVGGRPVPWIPSKRAMRDAGQTLVDSRRLQKSTTYHYSSAGYLEIGTNVKYAAIHQYGFAGSVNVKSHSRKVKSRDVKEKKKIIAKGIGFVSSHTRRMNMPARPFLVVQDEDVTEIKFIIKDYLLGVKLGFK